MPVTGRRPAWRQEGEEPDFRYSLANERTYLAWTRTALAFFAGAVGVVHFGPGGDLSPLRLAVAILLAVLGLLVCATVYGRWRSVERAARRREPMPHSFLPLLVAVVLAVTGVGVLVLVAAA